MRVTRTTKLQVARVLAGCTVTGRKMAAPMRHPTGPSFMLPLHDWINDAFHADGPRMTIAQRTTLIRKFASYLIRETGLDLAGPVDGISWFRRNPHLLTTKLSFAGAIQQARQDERREHNAFLAKLFHAAKRSAKAPCSPPPLVRRDGDFSLHRLTHPFHLRDTGLEAGNCLAQEHDMSHVANSLYWDDVQNRRLAIYALRHRNRLAAVFTVLGQAIEELEIVITPDGYRETFRRLLAAIGVEALHDEYLAAFEPTPRGRDGTYLPRQGRPT